MSSPQQALENFADCWADTGRGYTTHNSERTVPAAKCPYWRAARCDAAKERAGERIQRSFVWRLHRSVLFLAIRQAKKLVHLWFLSPRENGCFCFVGQASCRRERAGRASSHRLHRLALVKLRGKFEGAKLSRRQLPKLEQPRDVVGLRGEPSGAQGCACGACPHSSGGATATQKVPSFPSVCFGPARSCT